MKKIVFVIPTMRLGGAEKALGSLLNSMDKDRYDVSLFMFSKEGELLDHSVEFSGGIRHANPHSFRRTKDPGCLKSDSPYASV